MAATVWEVRGANGVLLGTFPTLVGAWRCQVRRRYATSVVERDRYVHIIPVYREDETP